MNKQMAVYPGSFDPVTLGHMDLIERAARLYEKLYVVILHNPKKRNSFTVEEREAMLRQCCAPHQNVEVASFSGLTVDFARAVGAGVIVRGLRGMGDLEAEQSLAQVNRDLCPEIETVFLMSRSEHRHISSSAVREMARYGCPMEGYVSASIEKVIIDKLKRT